MRDIALTYDDIQLVPRYSEIESRKNISLHTLVTKRYGLKIPLVAAPMDTVCGYEMAHMLMRMGGVGCIHRFMTIEEQSDIVSLLRFEANYKLDIIDYWGVTKSSWHSEIKEIPVMAAVGATGDYYERAKQLISAGASIILIDVAHGHHKNVKEAIQNIKKINSSVDIIAGNIATGEAVLDVEEWGANGIRVGIGGGSLCSTRIKTGFGIPNITCLNNVSLFARTPMMADGGIRSSGDIAKALALGASCVMIGSLFAGTEEAPGSILETNVTLTYAGLKKGKFKRYRGAASLETKMTHGLEERNVEGESTLIPYKGKVENIINDLLDGIRSALSYAGAPSIDKFNPAYIKVTNAGQNEAKPHLLK
jgi:IMP dehydrogenase